MSGGGAEREREGDTDSKAGSSLWAVSTEPDTELELTGGEIMAWAKVGHSTDWATQVPRIFDFYMYSILNSICLKKDLDIGSFSSLSEQITTQSDISLPQNNFTMLLCARIVC